MNRNLQFRPITAMLTPAAVAIAVIAAAFCTSNELQAAETLAYSFESPEANPDGFGPNGGGVTVFQDTIGATQGTKSLEVSVVGGATFVGALTGNIDPNIIGDPPGLDHVLFDLTITQQFTGAFAVIGVTVFGASQPGPEQQFGLQAQFRGDPVGTDEKHIDGLAPGTYPNMRIDLIAATHPLTFENGTFNEIFGTEGSGPNDIIPTGFQFYVNKSGDAPITFYIDNIRVGTGSSAIDGDYNGNGVVDAADYTVWRDNLGLTGGATPLDGDGTGDGNVTIDDYTFWKSKFAGSGSGALSGSAVPEPSCAILLISTAAWCYGRRMRRTAR